MLYFNENLTISIYQSRKLFPKWIKWNETYLHWWYIVNFVDAVINTATAAQKSRDDFQTYKKNQILRKEQKKTKTFIRVVTFG